MKIEITYEWVFSIELNVSRALETYEAALEATRYIPVRSRDTPSAELRYKIAQCQVSLGEEKAAITSVRFVRCE